MEQLNWPDEFPLNLFSSSFHDIFADDFKNCIENLWSMDDYENEGINEITNEISILTGVWMNLSIIKNDWQIRPILSLLCIRTVWFCANAQSIGQINT